MSKIRRVTVLAAAPLTILATILPASASTWWIDHHRSPSPAGPPMGLFVQVSSLSPAYPPATLRSWLEEIRVHHRDPAKPGYINSVVLDGISDVNGILNTAYLDVIAPYLPGGAHPAFDTAYVGSGVPRWAGSGSPYIQGVEDPGYRQANINAAATAGEAFKIRYPAIKHGWYAELEANASGFWDRRIERAYKAYLSGWMITMKTISPSGPYMWSPNFWTSLAREPAWALPALRANFRELFSHLPKPLVMNFQDNVGQSGGTSTPQDAVAWAKYLNRNFGTLPVKFQVNAEQFTKAGTADTRANLAAREAYYASQRVPLGPAFEIRYWPQRTGGGGAVVPPGALAIPVRGIRFTEGCPVLAVPKPALQRELEAFRRRNFWHLPTAPTPSH